jgi:hypothetical protein
MIKVVDKQLKLCDNTVSWIAQKFLPRRKNNELLAGMGSYQAQVQDCQRDTGNNRLKTV